LTVNESLSGGLPRKESRGATTGSELGVKLPKSENGLGAPRLILRGRQGAKRDLREENSEKYAALVASLKQRIRDARLRASVSVNQELVLLYWGIGRDILLRQQEDGWGSPSHRAFGGGPATRLPDMTGLSARNLGYMKAFAEAYPDSEFLQQVVAKLPWGHNVHLLEAVKGPVK
jgi:predicted nuclease of restriction endonuclease-like (RecB) superfamily